MVEDVNAGAINWRRGALRLWVVASVLWCTIIFSMRLSNENVTWLPSKEMVNIKISDTVTWDYPAEWGVEKIRDDLKKRLVAKDEEEREWAAHVPASLKAQCGAIPPTTPFADQPADCVRLFFSNYKSVVPTGWESQIAQTAPHCKNGAPSCKPWERDWNKGDLKPGSVVSEEGIIEQPRSVSAWEVIAAAIPWAIIPPLAALAFGSSLFWGFAGFKSGSK